MASKIWRPAYIGLGSNVGESILCIERAIREIGGLPDTRVILRSAMYRSAPFGPVAQDPFVNAVVGVLTRCEPLELLRRMRALEVQLGRSPPRVRWGPREIDLDLLVHGDTQLDSAELALPHPGIPERDFVLYPLRDIAPQLNIAGLGLVRELAARVTDRGIERLD